MHSSGATPPSISRARCVGDAGSARPARLCRAGDAIRLSMKERSCVKGWLAWERASSAVLPGDDKDVATRRT